MLDPQRQVSDRDRVLELQKMNELASGVLHFYPLIEADFPTTGIGGDDRSGFGKRRGRYRSAVELAPVGIEQDVDPSQR